MALTREELFIVARSTFRVLRNSEQTAEIHTTEELTGRSRFRRLMRRYLDNHEADDILRERPELSAEQVDYDALRQLPDDTLGAAYVRHLDDNGLTADAQATATQYIDDPDVAYLMRRFRQTHDVWHALTELGTQGHEEVILHAFSWGQLRLPVSALVVFFGTLKHIVGEGRYRALRYALSEAYRHGRDARPLLPVHWESMWQQPLDTVRQRLRVRPCTAAYVNG